MINLKIDPEFQNQIPPLTDDEYKMCIRDRCSKVGGNLNQLARHFNSGGARCV